MKDLINYFNGMAEHWDEKKAPDNILEDLVSKFNPAAEDTILDVGTGTGILIPFIRKITGDKTRVCALDISIEMLKRAKMKCHNSLTTAALGDAAVLPFRSEIFTKTICFAVIPHLKDKNEGLKELTRVTKTGGRIFIAHLMGTDKLNTFHSSLNGVVKHDVLPSNAEFKSMVSRLPLEIVTFTDRDDLFFLELLRTG